LERRQFSGLLSWLFTTFDLDQIFRARSPSGAFVTLCQLAPGEYDYRVELEGRKQPLLGKLVVEGRG
jgi:hypothetical protein